MTFNSKWINKSDIFHGNCDWWKYGLGWGGLEAPDRIGNCISRQTRVPSALFKSIHLITTWNLRIPLHWWQTTRQNCTIETFESIKALTWWHKNDGGNGLTLPPFLVSTHNKMMIEIMMLVWWLDDYQLMTNLSTHHRLKDDDVLISWFDLASLPPVHPHPQLAAHHHQGAKPPHVKMMIRQDTSPRRWRSCEDDGDHQAGYTSTPTLCDNEEDHQDDHDDEVDHHPHQPESHSALALAMHVP